MHTRQSIFELTIKVAVLLHLKRGSPGADPNFAQLPITFCRLAVTYNLAVGIGHNLPDHRIVQMGHQTTVWWYNPHQEAKRFLDRRQMCIDIGMIKFDTGNNSDGRTIVEKFGALIEEGGVILIPFNNEMSAPANIEIAPKGLDQTANHKTGLKTGFSQQGG